MYMWTSWVCVIFCPFAIFIFGLLMVFAFVASFDLLSQPQSHFVPSSQHVTFRAAHEKDSGVEFVSGSSILKSHLSHDALA